jgi:hypothetical protein
MAAQCGAGGRPKVDLLSTYTRLWCWPYVRRWFEPVDLTFLLSQAKYNWSLSQDDATVDIDTHDIADNNGACGRPKVDLLSTYTRLWCWPYVRRWSEPVDLPFLLSQAKYNWSLAQDDATADIDTHDMADNNGACGRPKVDLLSTYTRLWCWPYVRRWSEPVDLPFLLSQAKYNWSQAPVDATVDSDRHDMAAQCGAGGRPKVDLLSTYTRLWCWPYVRRWSEPVDLPFPLSQAKYNWSLAQDDATVDIDTHDIAAHCGAFGRPKVDLLSTYTRLWCWPYVRRWSEQVDLPFFLSQAKYN